MRAITDNERLREAHHRDVRKLLARFVSCDDALLSHAALRLWRELLQDLREARSGVEREAARLAELLASSSCGLATLDLTANELGPEGATALMPSLQSNRSLTALSLRENNLELAGAHAVASALRTNAALSTLWLGKNKLQNEGVEAIATAIVEAGATSRVAVLDLHKNGLSKPCVPSITRLIGASPTLALLGLAGSKLQFIETEAMQQAAKEKPEIGRTKPVRLWLGAEMSKWPDLF